MTFAARVVLFTGKFCVCVGAVRLRNPGESFLRRLVGLIDLHHPGGVQVLVNDELSDHFFLYPPAPLLLLLL